MAEGTRPESDSGSVISEEGLRKAEAYVEQEEGAANRLSGIAGALVTAIAVSMTLFHLYAAFDIVADAGAALHPRCVRAGAQLHAISALEPFP